MLSPLFGDSASLYLSDILEPKVLKEMHHEHYRFYAVGTRENSTTSFPACFLGVASL